MNFIEEYKKGQTGVNLGLPMGSGLQSLSKSLGGVQRARLYGVAAAPKVGKSTLVDYGFVIEPYLYASLKGIPVEWIYYSYEIDRVSKEFDFVSHFLYEDFKIEFIKLEDGRKYLGKEYLPLNSDYLRGRLSDDDGKIIKVKESVFEAIKKVYENRIIPIFGEYSSNNYRIKPGVVNVEEHRDNPTGIYKSLISHAEKQGKFIYSGGDYSRVVGYEPNDPDKYTIVVTDHLRKLIPERGWGMKQTVDKMLEYHVSLKNLIGYTFVDIIHTNRSIVDQDRLRFTKDTLYPTAEDIKETGNLSEDADHILTMFNPNDSKYMLKSHFGVKIKDDNGNSLYPDLRTIHLVESRHVKYPQHFKTNMKGAVKSFEQIKI